MGLPVEAARGGLMTIFERLFRRMGQKPRAVVFVDYEHWYYSYKKLYHMEPDLRGWYDELARTYEIAELMFFGAFAQADLKYEAPKIRALTNTIIATDNKSPFHKKDMTDFIMLDYIYQRELENDRNEVYVIFTGDGHFQSVVRYLTQKRHKTVVVYGVREAFSRQLQAAATNAVQLPAEGTVIAACYRLIVDNFNYIAEHPEKRIIPTFQNTVAAVARHSGMGEQIVHAALQQMLDLGYVRRGDYRVEFNRTIKALSPDWEKLHTAGLWEYPV